MLRRSTATYLHCTGTQGSYGFFAPNVPDSYELIFELHRTDGSVSYQFATASSREGKVRLASLMDEISYASSEPLREAMIKLISQYIARDSPDTTDIHTIFAKLLTPSLRDELSGAERQFEVLSSYNFHVAKVADR